MRILIRLFAATIFFVLIAAAMIAVLQSPEAPAPGSESEDSGTVREATGRSVARTAATLPGPRSSGLTSNQPAVVPDVDVLPPAPELEQELRDRVSTSTPIYQTSSSQSGLLTQIDADDQVETGVMILNEDGLWLEVRLNRETYGFVRGADLSIRE